MNFKQFYNSPKLLFEKKSPEMRCFQNYTKFTKY